jgi:hypothetical protein
MFFELTPASKEIIILYLSSDMDCNTLKYLDENMHNNFGMWFKKTFLYKKPCKIGLDRLIA